MSGVKRQGCDISRVSGENTLRFRVRNSPAAMFLAVGGNQRTWMKPTRTVTWAEDWFKNPGAAPPYILNLFICSWRRFVFQIWTDTLWRFPNHTEHIYFLDNLAAPGTNSINNNWRRCSAAIQLRCRHHYSTVQWKSKTKPTTPLSFSSLNRVSRLQYSFKHDFINNLMKSFIIVFFLLLYKRDRAGHDSIFIWEPVTIPLFWCKWVYI